VSSVIDSFPPMDGGGKSRQYSISMTEFVLYFTFHLDEWIGLFLPMNVPYSLTSYQSQDYVDAVTTLDSCCVGLRT
jgi:hypothetical protein